MKDYYHFNKLLLRLLLIIITSLLCSRYPLHLHSPQSSQSCWQDNQFQIHIHKRPQPFGTCRTINKSVIQETQKKSSLNTQWVQLHHDLVIKPLNRLSPKTDQHEISPCIINALSNTVVMRIEDMMIEDEYDNIDTSKKSFPSLLLVIMHENNKCYFHFYHPQVTCWSNLISLRSRR